MTKRFSLLLAIVLLFACAGQVQATDSIVIPSGVETVTITREEYETLKKYKVLEEVKSYVDEYYYKEPDEKAMIEEAIQGYLKGLGDTYTFYYPAEAWKKMWEEDEGVYGGIGVQMVGDWRNSSVTITRVFRNTPAEAAGLKKGDVFYKVEDIEVSTLTMQDAVSKMRGKPGEKVKIEILRNGETLPFELTKAEININRIEYTMLENKVGYIALYEFAGDVSKAFQDALDSLLADGAKSLILDLRDNGGGWVTAGAYVADQFLDKELLYYTENRAGVQEKVYTQNGSVDIPLVVLINEFSASSSEIVTAALKDYKRATIMGTNSFGKGVIQYVLSLSDGVSGMQVTCAQYFSPKGNPVHEVGIAPDIVCEMPKELKGKYFDFGSLEDPQLKAAYDQALSMEK